VVLGFLVFAQWVIVERLLAYPHLGSRVGFDPFGAFDSRGVTIAFLAVRFYGLVLLVPVMEEMFFRGFLLRYLTDPDFESLPPGSFSLGAFAIVTALSALAHPEWIVAIVASAMFALLLRRTRSLFAAIVAHATANLALGVYILLTRQWQLW